MRTNYVKVFGSVFIGEKGGDEGARIGTIATGHYADLVLLTRNPLESVDNLDSVEWVMVGGKVWRPGQLRSGIAMR